MARAASGFAMASKRNLAAMAMKKVPAKKKRRRHHRSVSRYLRVHTELIEKVDAVGPKSFERSLGNLFDVLRATVEANGLAVFELEAVFGCDHDVIAEWRH